MQTIVMKLAKEIEDKKRNEESLTQSLRERSNECRRLGHGYDQIRLELMQLRNNEQELERQFIILRDEMVIMNEYKEKFKAISNKLDEIQKNQKSQDEKQGLGYEKGESSRFGQKSEKTLHQNKKPLVRQPNSHKFNGKLFSCYKFGHMASQCKNRTNQNT